MFKLFILNSLRHERLRFCLSSTVLLTTGDLTRPVSSGTIYVRYQSQTRGADRWEQENEDYHKNSRRFWVSFPVHDGCLCQYYYSELHTINCRNHPGSVYRPDLRCRSIQPHFGRLEPGDSVADRFRVRVHVGDEPICNTAIPHPGCHHCSDHDRSWRHLCPHQL